MCQWTMTPTFLEKLTVIHCKYKDKIIKWAWSTCTGRWRKNDGWTCKIKQLVFLFAKSVLLWCSCRNVFEDSFLENSRLGRRMCPQMSSMSTGVLPTYRSSICLWHSYLILTPIPFCHSYLIQPPYTGTNALYRSWHHYRPYLSLFGLLFDMFA